MNRSTSRNRKTHWRPPFAVLRIPERRPKSTLRSPSYRRKRPNFKLAGCLMLAVILLVFALAAAVYLLFPARTNLLLIGVDYTDPGVTAGRTDTIILATIQPNKPYVGLLSIPRDLWVTIPYFGENRINTAHFFAESTLPGSGPPALAKTIQDNFGVETNYYIRVHFDGFKDVINAMGGVDIELAEPMAGYEAGRYHLTGNKALAFVRQRMGSDDFYRMEHGQFLIKAAIKQMLNPLKWFRLPAVFKALSRSIDTNVPTTAWPRLGLALLRVGPSGIDSRTITRQMATSFITGDGADVLQPHWDSIRPMVAEMFGPETNPAGQMLVK